VLSGQLKCHNREKIRVLWAKSGRLFSKRRKRAVRDCHLVICKSSAGSLDLKCARNGRKFREGQGERELLPSARCEHIVCSCQQIGAPWPSTCLGMRQSQRLQPTTDSLQHTREDQKPPATPGEPTYLWDPEYKVSKQMAAKESQGRPHSVAGQTHLPTQESSLRAWHHTALYNTHQPPGSEPRAPLARVHKKSGAINSSSKNREWNKWDFSGSSATGGVCTRSEDVRARTSIPRGRLSPNTLTWGFEVQ